MKVVVIGSGYVGLVSAACLASVGHSVCCLDKNKEIVKLINEGISPFHEKGLPEILNKVVKNGALKATTDLETAIKDADISIIAVGTPFQNGSINTTYIENAARELATVLHLASKYHVVCVKSTVTPGTTENIVKPIINQSSCRKIGANIGICMNPEFLAEGTAVNDFMNPDRIIIGASDPQTANKMQELYQPFHNATVILTSINSSETMKYASNALLATLISFTNEISNLCADIPEVDAVDVFNAVQLDRRWSPSFQGEIVKPGILSFLHPGTGYGGSCFPKDTKSLVSFGNKMGHEMKILGSVIETNVNQPKMTIELAKKELSLLSGKKIGVLGLSFKPGTDDIRESPAIEIINLLAEQKAQIIAHDPIAIKKMEKVTGNIDIKYTEDLSYLVQNVELIILVTSWPEYKNLDRLIKSRAVPVVDGRRFLDPEKFTKYRGIGKSESRDNK